jgi:hypothetical protein
MSNPTIKEDIRAIFAHIQYNKVVYESLNTIKLTNLLGDDYHI